MFDEQKPGEHELTSELAALEKLLRGLTPESPRIDRDRLMFEAGRAAALAVYEPSPSPSLGGRGIGATLRVAGSGRRFWPVATATMTAASLLLATMLVWQDRSQQFVAHESTKSPGPVEAVNASSGSEVQEADRLAPHDIWSMKPSTNNGYLGVRYVALTEGIGALPLDIQPTAADRDLPAKRQPSKPATARNLMDELLPARTSSNPSRS